VGLFGRYVLAVWVGNFDGSGNPAFTGRDAAAPLFFNTVDAIQAESGPMEDISMPKVPNVKQVEVCALSGKLPGRHCPLSEISWFIPGVSPIEVCGIHREVLVNAHTGLRACRSQKENVRREVYEFWPSDLLKIFNRAGIPRRVPPSYEPGCQEVSGGTPPKITSPEKNVVYTLRHKREKYQQVPLMAVTDADVREVFWFADKDFIGRSDPQTALVWRPKPGSYLVRAVDDQGRADQIAVNVKASP
jgi:penicillin-binding protein 1C